MNRIIFSAFAFTALLLLNASCSQVRPRNPRKIQSLRRSRTVVAGEVGKFEKDLAGMRSKLTSAEIESDYYTREARITKVQAAHDEAHAKVVVLEAKLNDILRKQQRRSAASKGGLNKSNKTTKKSGELANLKSETKSQQATEAAMISGLEHEIMMFRKVRADSNLKLLKVRIRVTEERVKVRKTMLRQSKALEE